MYDFFIKLGEIFLQLLNISITASWLVLAVVLAKFLLKRAPKWISCVLWALVAIRLLLPFDIESPLSLIPSRETMPVSEIYGISQQVSGEAFSPQVNSGFAVVDAVLQPAITETSSPSVLRSNISVIACIWLMGIAVMLVYSFISYMKVRKSIREAMHVQENIYLCDNISTPFILGLIKPKIYLPSSLYRDDVLYVIDHEKAHLKRLDHLWKPLGYLLLAVYWFNPVMWVAYVLLCRDIELACDEKAIKQFDIESKKEYSNALINCSSQRRLISACPLAFGETGVKNRIKSVLSYKKPAFWVIAAAVVLCGFVAVAFLTMPPEEPKHSTVSDVSGEKYVYYGSQDFLKPSITLKSNGEAIFNYSSYSSYIPAGKYTIEENILTLQTDDGMKAYVFNVTDEGLVFDAFNSAEIPTYKESQFSEEKYCPVPHKAVFIKEKPMGQNSYFKGTVLEVNENNLLVEPFPEEAVSNSANKISVSIAEKEVLVDNTPIRVGDKVLIYYDGMLQETFPAQVNGVYAVYITDDNEKADYHLGNAGVEYVEIFSRVTEDVTGEVSEYTEKITDKEKIQLFITEFNKVLDTSSVDELDTPEYPDNALDELVLVNVYAADGSSITVTFPGTERVRLGKNTRRLITPYERQMLLDILYNSRQREINGLITGTVGKLNMSNSEFLDKAYTLSNDTDYRELCDVYAEPPFISNASGFETYYYFNDEYVLFIEEGIQVSLRKISDPDYRHTIG